MHSVDSVIKTCTQGVFSRLKAVDNEIIEFFKAEVVIEGVAGPGLRVGQVGNKLLKMTRKGIS